MAQTLMVENNFSLSFLSLMFNRLLGLINGKDTESKTLCSYFIDETETR